MIATLKTGDSSTTSTTPVSGPGLATLYSPAGLALDPSGAVLVADSGHDRVRRIGPDGGVTTVAGHGGDDPPALPGSSAAATARSISGVSAIAADGSGNVYIALGSDSGIGKVSPSGAVSIVPIRVPGGGTPTVSALAVGPDGQLVGAVGNDVFKLGPDGTVTPVAGSGASGYTGDGGPATAARLNILKGLAVDPQGQLYIADSGNDRVRLVRSDGTIVTVAGIGSDGPQGDGGPAVAAKVTQPTGLALDDKGNLYITSGNQLRRVGSDGIITLVAGRADNSSGFYGDAGPATAAALSRPDGVARDSAGNLYVSDTGNNRVRKIIPEGTITTVG